ncbi:MAG: hypothetical protein UT17_C0003G0044 [Candidatus Woesebacteria bacterium GW2011_GWB1_39_10]|nr:MAG: hypothetical protein UT17_C0003G0044 [Candidatus Woesebacteria bacterium GW2011_GWB1_39_10]KKS90981.1 MAG: hypothetical protein UV66_C0001G0338 [Candidatus Woesebacteria bacterium GW2011_GWA1_43_12]
MTETISQAAIDYKQVVADTEKNAGDHATNIGYLKKEWNAYLDDPNAYSLQKAVETAVVLKASRSLVDRPTSKGIADYADYKKFLVQDPGRASFFRFCLEEEWKLACQALSKDGIPSTELLEKIPAQIQMSALLS